MTQLDLFDDFQANYEYALRESRKAEEKYFAAKKLRDDNCKHLHVVEKSYYFEGSYYDNAYTERWNECTVCGAKSEVVTEHHSWYG